MIKHRDDPDWDEFHDLEITNWKRVRSAMEHENELVNHRLTWLLSLQAFLFAAFALTFQASTKKDVNPDQKVFYQFVLAGFALIGILVGLYIQRPLRTAEIQHDKLRDWWNKSIEENADSEARHPPICGDRPNWRDRFLPQSKFPLVFVAAWIIFTFVVLGNIIANAIKPYLNVIGIITLGSVGALGLVSIGVMIGRRQLDKRPSRRLPS